MRTPQVAPAEDSIVAPPSRARSYPRWLLPALVYAVLTVLCALAAYWLLFSVFSVYDDEGFFDYTLKLFVAGHPLYNSVWSTYGPFYYLVFGGLFAAVGHPVTTDAGRLIQLTLWVATSLGLGLTAHRLTGRLALGVASLATSFLLLNAMISEPMHPAALICALLTAMVAVIAFVLPTRPKVALAVIGALAAALLLTKINVGVYAIISIAFATVMASRSLVRHAAVRWVAVAAFVLVGPLVMAGKLNIDWVRAYALLAVLSTLALVFVALPHKEEMAGPDDSVGWPSWLIGGFVGCVFIVLAIVFALGTTPGMLFHQIVWAPIHQASFLTEPLTLEGDSAWWSLGAVALAWTWRQRRRALGYGPIEPASLFYGLFRTVAGVAILLSLASESVFNIAPDAAFALAMPLAWVAAVPPTPDTPTPRERLARLLIPSLAILYCLVAYPVAGTQVLLGSILLVPCGAVCVADGWRELTAWNTSRGPGSRVAAPLTAITVALAVGTTFLYIVQPLQINHDQYRASVPLEFRGASQVRVTAAGGSAIDRVVEIVRSRCHTLISLPAMYSFNLWTGLPTPDAPIAAQPYWRELTSGQQVTLLLAAARSRALCLIRNDSLALDYGGAPLSSPIVNYLDRDFRPIAQFAPYTVEVRRS